MTLLHGWALSGDRHTGATPAGLVKAEIMKIRTTKTWRWFGVCVVLVTAWALLRNGVGHHYDLNPPLDQIAADQREQILAVAAHAHTPAGKVEIAAAMMTSGQFLGALFAMLLGVLTITNEFFHQTATATFMADPRRGRVIGAKLAATACFAGLFWLAGTMINLLVTPIYLRSEGIGIPLTAGIVIRSMMLNLVAFLLWGALGLGLGTLIRSQVGAITTSMTIYLVGSAAVAVVVSLLHTVYPHDWVLGTAVVAPAIASSIMVTTGQAFDHAPPAWLGLVVMTGYAVVFVGTGVASIRRQDIT